VEGLVRLFDLLNPHVKRVQLLINQILEVIRGVENAVDGPHQEREEDQADELKDDRERVLGRCTANVVTVADSCDYLKNPVEGKDVLRMNGLSMEPLLWIITDERPRVLAGAVVGRPALFVGLLKVDRRALLAAAEEEPDAGVDVAGVDHEHYEAGKP